MGGACALNDCCVGFTIIVGIVGRLLASWLVGVLEVIVVTGLVCLF